MGGGGSVPPEIPPGKGTDKISQTGRNLKQAEAISGKNWHLGMTFHGCLEGDGGDVRQLFLGCLLRG